jgi:threonine dehydrogenase-like Zn-dependent dehydrogenase
LILAKLVSMFGCSVVHKLSADFRAATKIVTVFYKPPVKPGHILIKVLYAGVNASDVSPLVESYICLPTVAVIFFFQN